MRNMEVIRFNYGALRAPDYVDNITIGTTAKTVTPPTSAAFVVFASDVNFYVRYSTTAAAALPSTATNITDGTGCELNPNTRYIGRVGGGGVTGMSIIGVSTGSMSLAWFAN